MQICNANSVSTHNGRYIHLRETPHGDLDLVLSRDGRDDFPAIDSIRNRYGNRPALTALLADHLARGWELVSPREIDAPVLGPILTRELERDPDASVIAVGRVYWYPEFAICDEIDELRRQGFLELRGST